MNSACCCTQFPELPLHFLKLQASRLRLLFAAMEDVNMLPLPARLAKQLVNLSHAYGVKEEDGVRINLHLPQEDLAQLLGSSRQRVNVLLSEWAKKNWIAVHYGHITAAGRAGVEAVGRDRKLSCGLERRIHPRALNCHPEANGRRISSGSMPHSELNGPG